MGELAQKPVEIKLVTSLPLGCGFGISAASTLVTSLALNTFFNLKMKKRELVDLAHVAEVKNKTGLGSVTTQAHGGFLLKYSPGITAKIQPINAFIGKNVYAVIIGKLETPSVLSNNKQIATLNNAADRVLEEIKRYKSISLDEIFDLSYRFVKDSLLLTDKEVSSIIEKIKEKDGHATMGMLGQIVLSISNPQFTTNYKVRKFTITEESARIV